MCGIAGFLDLKRRFGNQDAAALARMMADRIAHRGPDAGDTWTDAPTGIAFGHRRLSILDLSAAGAQPMISASGRSVICYNGEVYNPEEFRSELQSRGIRFRGHSDTEVILEAFEAWGVISTAKRLVGMFALAWWDAHRRTLWLLRDRVGKKPLYYGRFDGTVLFGSQLKALMAHPACGHTIDRDAVASYLRFGYFPSTRSVLQDLRQLRPGTALEISIDGQRAGDPIEHVYWDPCEVEGRSLSEANGHDLTQELDDLLRDAVRRRMIADVPLGAFLSGGIDSSTVVALMQEQSSRPVKTFSIGFDEPRFNEAPYAKAIAHHLGTDHTELYVAPATALELIPNLAEWYDEPFADASQVPTLLVAQLARRHVTVALSGDGGDELFHGYPWYQFGAWLSRIYGALPQTARHGLAGLLTTPSAATWDSLADVLPASQRPERVGDRIHKLAAWMRLPTRDLLFREIRSLWSEPEALVPGASEPVERTWMGAAAEAVPDFLDRMPLIDLITYLPDDILTKLDRATMAVSLEGRCPILDHRVVEFALKLPREYKNAGARTKIILKEVLARRVPRPLFERTKQGFESPIATWLRGPLRDWAEDLLHPAALAEDDLLNPVPIREKWAEHLSGRRNWQYALWNVLMLQEWKRRWA
ncbi:MAG: asparagine synthase (glutamine-hydrolyzing) [Deltaproteobacteria bacterium]|nr:asparagine synthase (glutamine-hydrolyzing) [Deltaproteobacteria bacterium]